MERSWQNCIQFESVTEPFLRTRAKLIFDMLPENKFAVKVFQSKSFEAGAPKVPVFDSDGFEQADYLFLVKGVRPHALGF